MKYMFLLLTILSQSVLADFVYGNGFYLNSDGGSATTFSILRNDRKLTYESVGPAGSSAAKIWPAMDDIPDGATMAIVYVLATVSTSKPKAIQAVSVTLFARQTGSTVKLSGRQQVFSRTTVMSGDSLPQQGEMILVPLDSLRRFDIAYSTENIDLVSIVFWLKGYVM